MPNVRIDGKAAKLTRPRINYLNGEKKFYQGRKQGDVFGTPINFADYVLDQKQLESYYELTIPLPTELLKRDNVDYNQIANDLITELGIVDLYGKDQVSAHVHYRPDEIEKSGDEQVDEVNERKKGRTNNKNLHVHIGYIDRTIIKERGDILYPKNKRPNHININLRKGQPPGKYIENAITQFKTNENTPVLNFDLVKETDLAKFKKMTSNGKKHQPDDFTSKELGQVIRLKEKIIKQAQRGSIDQIVYSNRLENGKSTREFKEGTLEQRQIVANVMNQVCKKYNLDDTLEEHGEYYAAYNKDIVKSKLKVMDEREASLDEREEKVENISLQLKEEQEKLAEQQLEFYHKMILKQTDQIREINELSDGKLKITDEVLESVNNSYFDNVYDYFSVGEELLEFNNAMYSNIEYAEMMDEDTFDSITDYFETGFEVVQNLVTKGINEIISFAKNISKALKKEQKENELITERNKIQLEDITSNYQKNRDVKEFYESKLEQLDTLEARVLLEESKKIDIEPVINKHIEIIEEEIQEIQEQIVSSEDISLFKEQVESIYSDYHYEYIDEDERDSKIKELEKEYHYNLTINEYEEINQIAWNKWDDDINEYSR